MRGVRRLHARLAVALVVDHHDREVRRLLHADGGERAHAHQHLAVTGDDEHPARRLRQREPEAEHRRLPHCAPGGKAQRRIPSRGDVPGRGAQTCDDKKIFPIGKKNLDHLPPAQGGFHWLACSWKLLMPITCCATSTASAPCAWKEMRSAACTCAATVCGSPAWRTATPIVSSTRAVAWPIGTCQGLNSPVSPRMVTIISSGKRHT